MNRIFALVLIGLFRPGSRRVLCCLFCGLLAVPSIASETQSPGELSVSGRLGLLSIEARQVQGGALIHEIQRRTGMLIVATPLPGPVTLSFRDLPVKQAFRRMFGSGTSFVLYYPGPVTTPLVLSFPARAWILPQSRQGVTARTGWKAMNSFVQMAYAEDPATRIYGLSELANNGKVDEHMVVSALWDAVSARDINVKTYAIQTLIKRGGGEGLRYAWLALQDPEPSIRMLAIEGARSHANARPLLQQALSDQDGGVRTLAAALLKVCLRQPRCAG